MNIAHGLLEECRYYLILISDLGYGHTEHNQTLEEVSRFADELYEGDSGQLLNPEF